MGMESLFDGLKKMKDVVVSAKLCLDSVMDMGEHLLDDGTWSTDYLRLKASFDVMDGLITKERIAWALKIDPFEISNHFLNWMVSYAAVVCNVSDEMICQEYDHFQEIHKLSK